MMGHGIDSWFEVGRNCTVQGAAASHPQKRPEEQQPAARRDGPRGSSQPSVEATQGAATSRP